MANYAGAKEVYEVVRKALAPWTAANGFRRWRGMVAGWERAADPSGHRPVRRRFSEGGSPGEGGDQLLRFMFEGSSRWGDSETGHSLTGRVQLDPAPGDLAATPIRQSTFTGCLIRPELDRLAAIQGTINQRRPALPAQYAPDFEADTLLGLYLRALYDPSPRYQEGEYVPLSYYSMEDVREWTRFMIDVLPDVLDRFVEGRTPHPIDTTPEHLKHKLLRFVR